MTFRQEQFDPKAWEELCMASLEYRLGLDRGRWAEVLRKHCGSASTEVRNVMGHLIDEWTSVHTGWLKQRLRKLDPKGVLPRRGQ